MSIAMYHEGLREASRLRANGWCRTCADGEAQDLVGRRYGRAPYDWRAVLGQRHATGETCAAPSLAAPLLVLVTEAMSATPFDPARHTPSWQDREPGEEG